ncbi:atos homolog protein A isoform X2 [Apodemus sylvaticus]|uniref:atos homolog protein A isoform X2 n=1 Tax=Apodemus sylvaticus TaxID=10129 RepID=UPI00224471F0|nr:atos homolog protein A isoform X2 [Apodemus sylvaticus]
MVFSGNKGLRRQDALDEYFEYDAEEFLVSLALLITEGRTPECSVKGRAESFHCPPAQSRFPGPARHECSDKLAQCRQARRTRSEVTLLWKNNLPIMVEVMLLPDCCYSDEGPSAEGTDLNDPAIKQDALLLERWILEPVPRQNGDRFIEEKALLLAVRSFVFFSQLSAWLSVSHGAIPRNILYRISAADVDLQWSFSQTPTEHVFPVPNVSHNVALKVSVQSLPRQAHYPVLTCSIHTSIGLYEKRIQEQELRACQHRGPGDVEYRCPSSPQTLCSKHTWTTAPVSALHVRSGMPPEYTAAIRNVRLCPGTASKSDHGAPQASVLGFSGTGGEVRSQEASVRTFKSLSVMDSSVSCCQSSRQPGGEPNPLIDSLIQDRQEVIARIAQHLIHCDPSSSRMSDLPFNTQESTSRSPKLHPCSQESGCLRRCKEAFSVSFGGPEFGSPGDSREGKVREKSETRLGETCTSHSQYARQPAGEANPLIGSLLQERQDVIARIAQHLEHIDPTAHIPRPAFSKHDSNSIPSKVFRGSFDDKTLLKKDGENVSVSASHTEVSLLGDRGDGKSLKPSKCFRSFKYSPQGTPLRPEVRTQYQIHPDDVTHTARQELQTKAVDLLTSSNTPLCSDSSSGLISRLEGTPCKLHLKEQETSHETEKQCLHCNSIDKQICTNKCTEKIKEEDSPGSLSHRQCEASKAIDSKAKVTVLEMPDCLNKYKTNCSNTDSKRSKICEQSVQLGTENDLSEDIEGSKSTMSDQLNTEQEGKTDSGAGKPQSVKHCLSTSERLKNADMLRTTLKHSSVWRKHNFHSLDGTSTRAFHPQTGLPLLSSPVPQRKSQSGCFDLDTSLLHTRSLSSKSARPCLNIEEDPDVHEKPFLSSSAPPITSLSLLGNFEESVLNYRLDPLGIVDGFTAEVGASGTFCPTHLTLPVEVSFYSVSDDNAPSPYMGVITLESLGKRGYRVPPSGTIQVTLFNPNKTVVKMFVVVYDLRGMPANHQTFLRQRTFSVPVKQEMKRSISKENVQHTAQLLRYLIHLRFQSSKSGKIYLHRDVRLLFSRKSMEVDSGAAYELKSYTESPTNPQFSPRC